MSHNRCIILPLLSPHFHYVSAEREVDALRLLNCGVREGVRHSSVV